MAGKSQYLECTYQKEIGIEKGCKNWISWCNKWLADYFIIDWKLYKFSWHKIDLNTKITTENLITLIFINPLKVVHFTRFD